MVGGKKLDSIEEYVYDSGCGGGGYYSTGYGVAILEVEQTSIGGRGGGPGMEQSVGNRPPLAWYKDSTGDGGKSGAGGDISYSNTKNIFAYNGNMITNGDYTTTYYEYNKDGSQTTTILNIYERKDINGNTIKFIPAKIFAQSGTIRETYTTNQGQFTIDKITRKLSAEEKLPEIAKCLDDVKIIKATDESSTTVTGYTNPLTPELKNQGIGSRSSDI